MANSQKRRRAAFASLDHEASRDHSPLPPLSTPGIFSDDFISHLPFAGDRRPIGKGLHGVTSQADAIAASVKLS
jgi:hypothetical protein